MAFLSHREKGGLKWAIQGENTIVPTTPGNAGFEFGEWNTDWSKERFNHKAYVDHVFGEASTTDQIYRTITRPIVHSVMQGFNGRSFSIAAVDCIMTHFKLISLSRVFLKALCLRMARHRVARHSP